jgi:hypothetical protein
MTVHTEGCPFAVRPDMTGALEQNDRRPGSCWQTGQPESELVVPTTVPPTRIPHEDFINGSHLSDVHAGNHSSNPSDATQVQVFHRNSHANPW